MCENDQLIDDTLTLLEKAHRDLQEKLFRQKVSGTPDLYHALIGSKYNQNVNININI